MTSAGTQEQRDRGTWTEASTWKDRKISIQGPKQCDNNRGTVTDRSGTDDRN